MGALGAPGKLNEGFILIIFFYVGFFLKDSAFDD
jgi:hypothetical protein